MRALNQHGSVLIQAIIAIAIFSAITASVVRLLQMQNNLSSKTAEQFEMTYLVDEIRNILSNPRACQESFKGKNARRDKSTTAITQIIEDELGDVYTFNVFEKGGVIKENAQWSFILSNIYLQAGTLDTSIESGTTVLHIEVSHINKLNNKQVKLTREIKLFSSIDNAENIQDCYSARGIGLGKEFSREDSSWLRTSDTKGHYLSRKSLQIGTELNSSRLNIKGPLKIGITDRTCLKEIAGIIRYNPAIDSMEVCSESTLEWRSLNLPTPLKNQQYSLRATLPIKIATTPREFKYCAIIYKNYDDGECTVTRLENGRWELNHISERSTFGACEATCFN